MKKILVVLLLMSSPVLAEEKVSLIGGVCEGSGHTC
jgi:hypothetical protein